MGSGGQEMVRKNRANRNLARGSFGKFSKRNPQLYNWGFSKEGFQFKEPDEKEVKLLRERFKVEQQKQKRLFCLILFPLLLGVIYVLKAFYF